MKVISIVGARPQYIKLAPLHRELLKQRIEHLVINTGQHYDFNLSGVFFKELRLPKPRYSLKVGSAPGSEMVARVLERTAVKLRRLNPDLVLVYGDTNSTLGAALAAAQLDLPLAHIESGLRCFDLTVPEELNRVVTDRISDIHFCPTPQSRLNLKREGITTNVHVTGDVLYDVATLALSPKVERREVLNRFGLSEKSYLFLTLHRSDSVDVEIRLRRLVTMVCSIREPVLFSLHPRTRKRLRQFGLMERLSRRPNLTITEPLGYPESLSLTASARMVLTDSGGLQREAYRFKVPTLILRDVTEWVELVRSGGALIVGFDRDKLTAGLKRRKFSFTDRRVCRSGAAARIAAIVSRLR